MTKPSKAYESDRTKIEFNLAPRHEANKINT